MYSTKWYIWCLQEIDICDIRVCLATCSTRIMKNLNLSSLLQSQSWLFAQYGIPVSFSGCRYMILRITFSIRASLGECIIREESLPFPDSLIFQSDFFFLLVWFTCTCICEVILWLVFTLLLLALYVLSWYRETSMISIRYRFFTLLLLALYVLSWYRETSMYQIWSIRSWYTLIY